MAAPAPVKVRILGSLAENPLLAEMRSRSADVQALAQLQPRLSWLGVAFSGLSLEQALALREKAQAVGAEGVLCKPLLPSRAAQRREAADVLIAGTVGSLRRLSQSLAETDPAQGSALRQVIDNWQKPPVRELHCGQRRLLLGEKTLLMGILNATPDSFSGDGFAGDAEEGLRRASQMTADEADILDVGGESSRPGAESVPLEEELRRTLPLIERIAGELDVPISIDTTKAKVAAEALARGACMVNDISALRADDQMAEVIAQAKAGVVLMHMQGTPRNMQKDPRYADLMGEIISYLEEGAERALAAGISKEQIVVDPGIGFGKTLEHNLEILRHLEELRTLGYPLLVGTSRKSMIGQILGTSVEERLEGTAATVALAIAGGADIVRVHDVKEMARVAKVADALLRPKRLQPQEEYAHWGEGG